MMLYNPKNDTMDQRECNTHREVILYQTEAMTQPKTQHDKKETKKEMT